MWRSCGASRGKRRGCFCFTPSSSLSSSRDSLVVIITGMTCVQVDSNGSQRNFQFNVVFEPDAMQEDVFENCGIKKLVDNAVLGWVVVVVAGELVKHGGGGGGNDDDNDDDDDDDIVYMRMSFKLWHQEARRQRRSSSKLVNWSNIGGGGVVMMMLMMMMLVVCTGECV